MRTPQIAVLVALLGSPGYASGQDAETVSLVGYVRAEGSAESVRSAIIRVLEANARVESNRFGFYALRLPVGTYTLAVTALGYGSLEQTVNLTEGQSLDLFLPVAALMTEGITVVVDQDPSDVDPSSVEMSTARIDAATLATAPSVLGEADPINVITRLPGVATPREGSTAVNVRGGGTDENLVLLDDAVVYNPSHIFGFFSVFNADAVDEVKLYKGGFPARYGGRLSSVLDIRQREGDAGEFRGAASIGLLSSRLQAEGPWMGGRGSYLVAGRRTYADLFTKLSDDPIVKDSRAYFYDLNLKANARISDTGQLMVSGYFGRDRFDFADIFASAWGNQVGVLRWNQTFGQRLFSHVTFVLSDYDYETENRVTGNGSLWKAGIRSANVKLDQTLYLNNDNTIEFGLHGARYSFDPGGVTPTSGSSIIETGVERRTALSPEAYLEHEFTLGDRFTLRYGVRGSWFARRGPGTTYTYVNDAPVVFNTALGRYERGEVADSVRHADGGTVRSFSGLEPRVAMRFGLGNGALKASYGRTRQYLFLVSNTTSPAPIAVWEPVGAYVEPRTADQWALGYAQESPSGSWQLSVEGYYKDIQYLVDYIDGADLTLTNRLETELLRGEGRAYGVEFLVRRSRGTVTGWVAYTLARAQQSVPSQLGNDPGVNGGEYYPAPHDRTHDLTANLLWRLGSSWTIGTSFTLASGLPLTLPNARYSYLDLLVPEFGPRNASRLPLYHRLDVSATKTFGRGELQFGVYNVYNRFNANSLSFRQNENNPMLSEAVQTSIFGIVPSVGYRFRF